jgi:hypothetical protein
VEADSVDTIDSVDGVTSATTPGFKGCEGVAFQRLIMAGGSKNTVVGLAC